MLAQPLAESNISCVPSLFQAASYLSRTEQDSVQLSSIATGDFRDACLMLDIAKLRLLRLLLEAHESSLFSEPIAEIQSRKLGVQLQRIYRDLLLVPAKLSACKVSSSSTAWNQYRTIVVVVTGLRLEHTHLRSQNTASGTSSNFPSLRQNMHEAVDGICVSASTLEASQADLGTHEDHTPTPAAFMDNLTIMWPLFCVTIAYDVGAGLQQWSRDALWRIGQRCKIPKAFSLVC